MGNIGIKVLRWIFFGVILALVPLYVTYLSLLIKDKVPTVSGVLADGGLLLIVSSFCAGALGEMIGSTKRFLGFKIVCSGATMVLLLLSALVFASVAEARLTLPTNESVVENTSVVVFVCGVLSCAACIMLSET